MSSRLLFRLPLPTLVRPWRREFDLRSRMSSMTRSELDRPRWYPATVGLSGKESEFDLVVDSGGGRGDWYPVSPRPEPRLPACDAAAICWIRVCEQKLMFDFRRLLCRSNVFCAEKGLGRTR